MQRSWIRIHKTFLLATKTNPNRVITPAFQTNRKSICLSRQKKKCSFSDIFILSKDRGTNREVISRARALRKQRNLHFGEVEVLYESQTRARSVIYFKTSGINWQLSRVSGKIQSYSFWGRGEKKKQPGQIHKHGRRRLREKA